MERALIFLYFGNLLLNVEKTNQYSLKMDKIKQFMFP